MPVEDGFDIQSPPVSPLLAMGTGPRFNRRWLIGIGAGLALLLSLIIFTLLCSVSFILPEKTVFLVTVSPTTANRLLTSEQRTTLPIEWQRSLRSESDWPVVFGLTGSRANTRAFVIGPRWAVPKSIDLPTQTRGLIRQIGESPQTSLSHSEPETNTTFVYREAFFDHLFSNSSLEGWADASPFFPNSSSSNRIVFSLDEKQLTLTDTLPALTSNDELKGDNQSSSRPLQTDLSLHLSALSNLNNIEGLLGELPLAPLATTLTALKQIPASLSVNVTSSTLDQVALTFREPLSSTERTALQTTLDQSEKRRVLTLPDGTAAVELFVPSSTEEVVPDQTRFDWLTVGKQPSLEAAACSRGTWIARFSPGLLSRLMPADSRLSEWLPTNAIQVWRNERSLTICLESE